VTEGDGQFFDQVGGLLERHVAIRVAMDQQQRAGRQFAMLATNDDLKGSSWAKVDEFTF
jgi:hypothetical protein